MRGTRLGIVIFCVSLIGLALGWVEWIRRAEDPRANLRILDRQGIPLAQSPTERYGYRRWVPIKDISPALIQAVLQQEDRRFFHHWGIDPRGIGRALIVNWRSGRWSQGGSTISQQLGKILLENWQGGRVSRNIFWKFLETLIALNSEWHWSKEEILERYLNSVYLGNRLYGVEAASLAYFGKSSRDLNVPQAGELTTHLRRPNRARPIFASPESTHLAPHLLAMFSEIPQVKSGDRVVATTLDAGIQTLAARVLRRNMERLRELDPKVQGALVVIDIAAGELRALVGSEDFGDTTRGGQVNHATALRQPGSTLKPFTYFLAFLHGKRPADLVLDAPYHFYLGEERAYSPNNFDRRFHGVMPIREALANSLNIPAVLTLEEMGTAYYLDLLRSFGFLSLDRAPNFYGLALTLGSGSVSLLELTNAYAALARGGAFRPLALLAGESDSQKNPKNSEREKQAAFLVSSILSDPEARRAAFGDAALMGLEGKTVAVKTGTSHGSRDAWAVGYTSQYAVGVWIGHSDNSPMPAFSGAEAAIPAWHGVMAGLHKGAGDTGFSAPADLTRKSFCRDNACEVLKSDWTAKFGEIDPRLPQPRESFRLISPVDGDHYLWDPKAPADRQQVRFRARLPQELQEAARINGWEVRWLMDGREVAVSPWDRPETFLTLPPGRHEMRAVVGDTKTRIARLTVSRME